MGIFYFSLAAAWIGHFLVDMMIGIWPVYKTVAELDIAIAGIISGFGAFFGEGMQLLFGTLSDKGYRKMLVLGGVIAAGASACLVYAPSYSWCFALYLLTCLGSAAFHPSAASMVGDLPSSKKGLLMAVFASGGSFGLAFSQIIFMQSYQAFDGHTAWLALPAFILLAACAFSTLGAAKKGTSPTAHKLNFRTLAVLFKKREVRLLYLTLVAAATLLWTTLFLLPDVLQDRGYEPWLAYGGGHMAFVLGGAILMFPAGYLADKFSARAVIATALTVGMVLFYALLVNPLWEETTVVIFLFLIGASISVIQPVGLAMGARLLPHKKGLASALLMGFVWCISESFGQIGGGLLTKCFTDDAPAKALAVFGGTFLLGLFVALQLPVRETPLEEAAHAETVAL